MRPRRWQYVLGGIVMLLILIPLWAWLSGRVMLAWRPDVLESDNAMNKLLVWSVAAPVLLVVAVVGWRWSAAQGRAAAWDDGKSPIAASSASAPESDAGRADYVLEVVGLGVTYEKYRQGKFWEALSKGSPYASLRETDPKKYPWSGDGKRGQIGNRANDAMENGARALPMYWGTPAFSAGWARRNEIDKTGNVLGDPDGNGMGAHLFVGADGEKGERIDHVVARVFEFFDKYPDVPYVVVSAADSTYDRDGSLDVHQWALRDGYFVPPVPDSFALFVLARRDRIERVRPYAFTDVSELKDIDYLNTRGFGRRLYLEYINFTDKNNRNPTVDEWLQLMRAFVQRDDVYPKHYSMIDTVESGKRPPKDFRPSPWFPIPWSKTQLDLIDKLPTLGYLHRPVFVKTVDEHGEPLSRRDARAAALAAGWQQALQTLPEADRKSAPTRVAVSTGGNTDQTVALTTVLNGWAAQGGPELDHQKPTKWIDTDARLGNTGAATWFMQMAIGVMGSYKEGGTSAAINLRDPREASIVFITPPSDEKRNNQQNAAGGDVWRSIVGPAIDPDNYKQP